MTTTPTLREAAQQALAPLANATTPAEREALTDADAQAADAASCDLRAALAEQAEPVVVPAGYALVPVDRLKSAAAQAKLAADCIVGFAKDKPGRMCGWLDDACSAADTAAEMFSGILAAPPAPARQPAPALTVGMLMEAGLMVGSTPDSVGTSNWAVRMLGALRALAVDQPDAPPAPAPTWPEWAEQILKIVREYSGYDGYDDEDGVDLPEEVREALEELTTQIERLEAKAPTPARQEWQPLTQSHVDYVLQYGGRCRECADWNGICPSSGLPCGGAEKAVQFVLRALNYGFKHGYITAAPAEGGAA